MRLSVFLILLSTLQTFASVSLAQQVTLQRKNITVKQVFKTLRNQTNTYFMYRESDIDTQKKVSVDFDNATLKQVLNEVCKQANLKYELMDDYVLITPKPIEIKTQQQPKKHTITGKVTDENGETLPGVSVVIKGTTIGVSTDVNGNYSLKFVPKGQQQIVFSFVGMVTQAIAYSGQSILNITLKADKKNIEEVVVIGYGSQAKREVTSSVVTVKAADIVKNTNGNASFDRSLGGLMKGVNITQNSGAPGAGVNINIRGYTSPSSGGTNQPLFVIDGVAFNTDAAYSTGGQTDAVSMPTANPLLSLNPESIESVSVLKDAAATAIYGSRGANGVIIVTTKKGNIGEKMTVNFSATTSIGKPIGYLNLMNTQQWKSTINQVMKNTVSAANAGQIGFYSIYGYTDGEMAKVTLNGATRKYSYNGLNPDFFGTANTNWDKEVYRNSAITQRYNISARGGTQKTNYALAFGYTDQDGLMLNENMKLYNFNTNLNSQINDIFKVGTALNLSYSNNQSGENLFGRSPIDYARKARPDVAVKNSKGDYERMGVYTYGPGMLIKAVNPVQNLTNTNELKGYGLVGNVYLQAEVIKNLKIKAETNIGLFYTDNRNFLKAKNWDLIPGYTPKAYLSQSEQMQSNTVFNLTADYKFNINENHKFTVMVGKSWDRTNIERTMASYMGFPDDDVLTNVNNAEKIIENAQGKAESGLNSTFLRTTYNFSDKYFATFNLRDDASSKFGPDNKHGLFPSLSVGWNITKEDFMQSKLINNLNLRLSYGKTGSANIGDFQYLQFFKRDNSGSYNGVNAIGFTSQMPNRAIGWETTNEFNFGLDFRLLNNRIYGDIDVYSRKTTGALSASPFPQELGPNWFTSNVLDITNKGVELMIGANIIDADSGFNWKATLNWAFNRNKLDDLNGIKVSSYLKDYFIEGEPLGTFRGYKVAGIFQNQAEVDALNAKSMAKNNTVYDKAGTGAGDYRFVDTNGDGHITIDDKVILGSSQPDFFGGLSNTFSYKGFELLAQMQFSVGGEAVWGNALPYPSSTNNYLQRFYNNTWTPENKNAKYPRIVLNNPGQNTRINNRKVYKTSYLRLKTLQLSYNVPYSMLNKIGVDRAKLFVSCSNLFTITDWPGLDPETVAGGSYRSGSQNDDPYPLAKTISLGINVQF